MASPFYLKMRQSETIRDFMKRFGAVILQLDTVSMDTMRHAIKNAIHPNTQLFASLSLYLSAIVNKLFQMVNQYAMLEYDTILTTKTTVSITNDPG